jgi:hypothetical protein
MLLAHIPCGLSVIQLAPDHHALAEDCRRFCLRAIKDTYGYGYTPELHSDPAFRGDSGEGGEIQHLPH